MHSITLVALSAAVALAAPTELDHANTIAVRQLIDIQQPVDLQFGKKYTYKEIEEIWSKKSSPNQFEPSPPPLITHPDSDTITNIAVTGEFDCVAGGFIVGDMAAQAQLCPTKAEVIWTNVDGVDGFSAGNKTTLAKPSGQQSTTNVAHHDFCRAIRHSLCTYRIESQFTVNVNGGQKITGSAAAKPAMKENCINVKPGESAECPKAGTSGCWSAEWDQ